MSRHVFIFLGVLALLAVPPAVLAQSESTSGSIVGTVKDETGAVMPGVAVTLTGERVQGSQTFVSTPRGAYRFSQLVPGSVDLEYVMDGFATLHRQQIVISVGQTVELNVTLRLSDVAETVTVIGETPIVDTRSTKMDTILDQEWVENAPTSRFVFFDYLNQAPGVSLTSFGGSGSSVMGSGRDENAFMLDGTNIVATAYGNSFPWPDIDAIEEVEILTLGAPAEYAHAAGAVYNIVTRSGSNDFHGDANFYLQTDGMTGRNTSDEEDDGLPFRRNEFTDFTAQLGGPIVHDKLWFFAGFQRQVDAHTQPGSTGSKLVKKRNWMGKVNYQANDANKINFMWHRDYFDLPDTPTANDGPGTVGSEHGYTDAINLGYTNIISQNTLLEAHVSGFWAPGILQVVDASGNPDSSLPIDTTRFYNLDTGLVTGGVWGFYDSTAFETGLNGKLTHYAEDFLGGDHEFKFGVQWERGGVDGAAASNDYVYTYDVDGTTYAYGYDYEPYAYSGIQRGIGFWFDDSWQVSDRLTLNLGLRYDNKRASVNDLVVTDGDGNPTGAEFPGIPNLWTWTPVSPRVGLNYQLTEDGKTIVKAHYGRYYRAIVGCEFCRAIGSSPNRTFSGDYDLETNTFINPVLDAVLPGANSISPNYTDPYTDQFIVGFDRELGDRLALQVNYAYKKGQDYPAWRDTTGVYEPTVYIDDQGVDATGQAIPLQRLVSDRALREFEIDNDDRLKTNIHALTVQVIKRMSDNWQTNTSISYVRSRGALRSSTQGARGGQNTALSGSTFGQNPNDFTNINGILSAERPWMFKSSFLYHFPHDFLVAVNYLGQSGKAWPRQIQVSTDVTGISSLINVEERDGSRRVETWHNLDVRLQKLFKIGPQARVGAFFDFLNVLNTGTNEDVLSRRGDNSSFAVRSNFLPPRRIMLGVKFQF